MNLESGFSYQNKFDLNDAVCYTKQVKTDKL